MCNLHGCFLVFLVSNKCLHVPYQRCKWCWDNYGVRSAMFINVCNHIRRVLFCHEWLEQNRLAPDWVLFASVHVVYLQHN